MPYNKSKVKIDMHFSCMQVTIFVKSNKKFTNTFVRIFFNKYVKIITYKQLPIWATLVAVVNPMSDFRCTQYNTIRICKAP